MNMVLLNVMALAAIGCANAATGTSRISDLYIDLPEVPGVFSMVEAPDKERSGPEWLYVVRLDCCEWNGALNFSVFLARSLNDDSYSLAYYDSRTSIGPSFDLLIPDRKLSLATSAKKIDVALAETIYDLFAVAFSRAGSYGQRSVVDGKKYRITAYSSNRGFLCGEALERVPDSIVDRVVTTGILLRDYIVARPGSSEDAALKEKIYVAARLKEATGKP